ncbi:MAG: AAA family ATPase [Ruminococcus sp.]|nr:AAA family ATPase [Ruminococcus sp.]
MLKRFEAEGFKNFQKRIVIDFSDVHDYKFNKECVTDGLLSKIIVYGKNSVGKTNLGLAIFDVVSHLTDRNVTPVLYDYYLNANTLDSAKFRYVFEFRNDTIDYRYIKDKKRSLLYEEILINNELLFNYDYSTKKGNYTGLKVLNPSLVLDFESLESVLRYIINNTKLDDTHPLRKMMKYVSSMLWFRNLDENRYIGYKSNTKDYLDFVFENDTLEEFQEFLYASGINDKLSVKTDPDGVKRLYIDSKVPMPFLKTASSGTKALYTFFYWYKTAQDVSLMFIDEFDAYYHYELSESIVKLLEKMTNTQVILTSHNTNLLSNRIMRPDCYFILTKDKLTSLVNATDRELREGHNLEKLYMSGEFNE